MFAYKEKNEKKNTKESVEKNHLMTFVDTCYSYNHRYSSSNMMYMGTKEEIDDSRKLAEEFSNSAF